NPRPWRRDRRSRPGTLPPRARTRTLAGGSNDRWRPRPRNRRRSPALRTINRGSAQIFDPQNHEEMVVGIDDDAVGAGEMTVGGGRDVLHRDGIVDIAADHIEITGLDCN